MGSPFSLFFFDGGKGKGKERERERILSMLHAQWAEPDVGLVVGLYCGA